MKKFLRLFCILLSLVSFLPAQTTNAPLKISIVGTADGCGMPERASLVADLKNTHFPEGWTVYVACNALSWDSVQRHFDMHDTGAMFTSRKGRFTVVNIGVYKPDFDFNGYEQRTTAGMLRHELGHVVCDSANESVANRYADTGTCGLAHR